LKTQPNFRIHLFFALLAIATGYYLQLLPWEWLVIIFTITLVLVAEMINTALESMTDLITNEYRESAKVAKDTAAGMVLVTAACAVTIGLIIYLPHLSGIIK
jgi:undecaprenol kinase/diacylglycerol kinase (ATP)